MLKSSAVSTKLPDAPLMYPSTTQSVSLLLASVVVSVGGLVPLPTATEGFFLARVTRVLEALDGTDR